MFKKKIEQLCEELGIDEERDRAMFQMGYTFGFLAGELAGPPPHRPSCKFPFPDAETR